MVAQWRHGWSGGYYERGMHQSGGEFANEADARAWAEKLSSEKPHLRVGVSENVARMNGGNYTRPCRKLVFQAGKVVDDYRASASV